MLFPRFSFSGFRNQEPEMSSLFDAAISVVDAVKIADYMLIWGSDHNDASAENETLEVEAAEAATDITTDRPAPWHEKFNDFGYQLDSIWCQPCEEAEGTDPAAFMHDLFAEIGRVAKSLESHSEFAVYLNSARQNQTSPVIHGRFIAPSWIELAVMAAKAVGQTFSVTWGLAATANRTGIGGSSATLVHQVFEQTRLRLDWDPKFIQAGMQQEFAALELPKVESIAPPNANGWYPKTLAAELEVSNETIRRWAKAANVIRPKAGERNFAYTDSASRKLPNKDSQCVKTMKPVRSF